MNIWLWIIVAASVGQCIILILTIREHRFLGAIYRGVSQEKIQCALDGAKDALSCSFGLELQLAGIKAAWPADEMSATAFGNIVTDWIIHTGRQDLTLREIAECVERGDHKGADGQPYRPS